MYDDEMPIADVLAKIQNDSQYWSPESREVKLVAYLIEFGDEIEHALIRLPIEVQEMCDIVGLRAKARKTLTSMLETGVAPPTSMFCNLTSDEIRTSARQQLTRYDVEDEIAKVQADRIALSFLIQGSGCDYAGFKVGTFDELLAETDRLGKRYELSGFTARAAASHEVSDDFEP